MRISRPRRALALVLAASFAFLGGGIPSVLAFWITLSNSSQLARF